MKELNYLQKLSKDILDGNVTEFANGKEAEDKLRQTILDTMGGTFNYLSFMDNRYKVYAILKDTIDIGLESNLEAAFSQFVEIHNTNYGDKIEFVIEDPSLFRVGVIARGTTDIRRQTMLEGTISLTTERLAIKIYTELEMFLADRVDWARMITKVTDSFSQEVGKRMYNVLFAAYTAENAAGNAKFVNGAYNVATLRDLVAEVESDGVSTATIYGTKSALAQIIGAEVADSQLEARAHMGHYGMFEGTTMTRLPQGRLADGTLAISNNFLLVCPAGEKIMKMVIEGEAEVYETNGTRKDQQIEHMFAKRIGIAAITARSFGVYYLA